MYSRTLKKLLYAARGPAVLHELALSNRDVPAQFRKPHLVLLVARGIVFELGKPVVLVGLRAASDPASGLAVLVPETSVDEDHFPPADSTTCRSPIPRDVDH